jgi:hypothetical protein
MELNGQLQFVKYLFDDYNKLRWDAHIQEINEDKIWRKSGYFIRHN